MLEIVQFPVLGLGRFWVSGAQGAGSEECEVEDLVSLGI